MAAESTISVQEYFANLTEKSAADLEEALMRIPEDRRSWNPEGKGRSAFDQVAEVAMLNDNAANLIRSKAWPADYSFEQYFKDKAELAQNPEALIAKFRETLPNAVAAMRAATDEDLTMIVPMPWGPMKLVDLIGYPYWNMSYHLGQINYIASMLGCLA